eukprot:3269450-Alexandrium_andersonii.AAC.1
MGHRRPLPLGGRVVQAPRHAQLRHPAPPRATQEAQEDLQGRGMGGQAVAVLGRRGFLGAPRLPLGHIQPRSRNSRE